MKTSPSTLLHPRQIARVKKLSRQACRAAREIALHGSGALLAFFALFGFNPQLFAANETWNGGSLTDGNWSDTANWVGGAAPGSVSGTNSTDIATFNSAIANTWGISPSNPVVIDQTGQNIGSINFDTLAGNYFIGSTAGNPLLLTTSGTIQILSTLVSTNAVETINAPLAIQGAAYTFANGSFNGAGVGAGTLNFGGAITSGAASGITTLTLAGANTNANTISGVIGGGGGATVTLTKIGTGIWDLSGANTYGGATAVDGGALVLNFNASGAPTGATGIISSSSPLQLGGGTLTVIGSSSGANAQAFATTAIGSGFNKISAAPASGSSLPTLALGTMTGATGATVEFLGPAYNSGASSGTTLGANPQAATATITATANTVNGGLIANSTSLTAGASAYATVNAYDWAAISTGGAGAASAGTIVGASQLATFYTEMNGGTVAGSGNNLDITATITTSVGSQFEDQTWRFNTNSAAGVNLANGGGKLQSVGGILVTPNVGLNNVPIAGSGANSALRPTKSGAGSNEFVIWQNNTLGELTFNTTAPLGNGSGPAAAANYVQAGPGTVTFAGSNTYSGQTYLDGGVTQIAADGGLGGAATSNVNLNGGTVLGNYSGNIDTGSSATAHPIVLGNDGGGLAATAPNTLTVDGIVSGAAGTGPVIIGLPTVGGLVPGTGAGTANATAVNATGVIILSNTSNTYAGGTVIDSGVLQVNNPSLNVLGTGGITLNGGTFQWGTGISADISARTVTLATTGTFDTQSNIVTLANPIGNGGAGGFTKVGSGSLTLDGANTFRGGVTLSGGNLTFGAPNVYTGATAITAGTLTLTSGASLGNTNISVGNGGTLLAQAGNGGIGAGSTGLTLGSGSTLSEVDGSIGTLALGGNLTIGGSSAANLDFELNNLNSDTITVGGSISYGAGGGAIFITSLGSSAPASGQEFTLLTDPAGLGSHLFTLGTTSLILGGQSYTLTLANSTATQEIVTLNGAALNYYFTGNVNSSWSSPGNFATDHTGATPQSGNLGSTSNVFLTSDSPATVANVTSETLDGSYTINSLSFTGTNSGTTTAAASNSITLGNGTGTNILTISAGNAFSDAAGNNHASGIGLVVQGGSAAHTITANIDLGNSQTWEIHNSAATPLTVMGVIADGSTLDSLTKGGSGTLIFDNANTYDGGTFVTGGTLALGPGGSLSSAGALTVAGTGTFDLAGNSQAVSNLSDSGTSTGTITASTGASTLTVNNTASNSFSGAITDNNAANGASLALVLQGPGNMSLSGSNNFSGGTTVVSGNLTVSNNNALGSSTSQNTNAGLTFNNSGTVTAFFTSASPNLASLNTNPLATGTDNVVLGNPNNGGAPTTLNLGAGGSALYGAGSTFTGTISDLSATVPAAVGNLNVDGGGFVILSGVDTFTGLTTVSGSGFQGPSELLLKNALALENSTLNFNNQGGILSFGSLGAATLGGLTGTEGLVLSNASGVGVTLTIGNNNVSSVYTGNLSGAGSVIKAGTGTVQFGSGTNGGATYAGATTVNTGTLIIGGTSDLVGGAINISQSSLTVQDNAIINSTAALFLDNLAGNPTPANLTVSGTASVTVPGFSFGNNTRAGGTVTIQNSASLIVNGTYDLLNNLAGTGASVTTTTNLNGGTLAVQNFILADAANGATTATILNLNGGTLEALANDPAGSSFIPVIAKFTANVQAGGAIINSNGFNVTIAQPLVSGVANDGGLTKIGAGALTLSGANTYVGPTNINGGQLNLANASAIADSSRVTFGGGALQYSASNTTDYSAKIINSTGPVAIDVNGQKVNFATALAASNVGGLTVSDAVSGVGSLTLTNANAYSGPTTINTGATLTLGSGGSLPNTAVTVNGTLLAATGNAGIGAGAATVTLGSGSSLSLVDGLIGSLTINGGITIGGSSAANLDFEINTDTSTNDAITVTGGPIAFGAGGGVINLTNLGTTTAPTSGTEITLITDANGLGLDQFALGQTSLFIDGQSYVLSLAASNSTQEIVTLTQASLDYYWTGSLGSSWNAIGNFTADPAGTQVRTGSLNSGSDIFLTANSAANFVQTLDGNYTINSLSFTGAGTSAANNPITLSNGTGTALTIGATSAFADANSNNYAPGVGLVVQAGAAANIISANIDLGNSQIWEIDNSTSNPLTVTGVIADGSTLDSLTKTGPGVLVLSNAETYDGGTIVKGGTVALGVGGSLSTSGTLTATGTGTFDLAGNNQAIAGLADGGVSTGTVTSSTGAATLTVNNSVANTYSGALTDNNASNGSILALVLDGPANITLSGSSNFSGGTTLLGGNLTVAANNALGNAASTNPNSGLLLNPGSGAVTAFFNSAHPAIATLNTNPLASGSSNVVLGSTIGAGAATTLNVGSGGGTSDFGGVISDLSTTVATAIGNLNVTGGALTLSGTDTFTGTTTVSAGTLTLANALALENSTLNYNNQGGTFSFGALTAATLAGLTGSENLALTNSSSAAVILTIGNNNVSSTYDGSLNGPGSVIKSGTGTSTFSNANYTGATTINAGTLVLSGGFPGSTTSNVTVAETGNGLNVSGGTLTAGTLNIAIAANQTGGSASITGAGSGVFTSVVIGSTGDSAGGLTINTTGSVSLGTVTIVKLNAGAGANAALGLTVQAGTVTATSVDSQGDGDKSSDVNISGGSLTIGNSSSTGAFQVGNNGDGGFLNMSGGSLTYLGTDGLLLGTAAGSTGSASITGGIATLTGITLNSGNATGTTSDLTVSGGATLYLGSVGLVANQPGATVVASLGTATVGATASWTSSAPITLTGATTFQAADSGATAHNISLGAALSGTGGLIVSGAGRVTLAGADTYTGATAVNSGGTLIVSGSLSATSGASVSPRANLEVDGLLNNSITAFVSGQLSGVGSIGPVNIASGGTLAPGLSAASLSAGVLTANGAVTLGAGSTFSIRLGVASAGDNDQLAVHAGDTVSLNGANLQLTLGSNFAPQTEGFVFVLINGGTATPGAISGTFAQGSQITDSQGNLYDILYNVDASGAPGLGSDVDLVEAVPEPGALAMILGGMGVLAVWRRSRRHRGGLRPEHIRASEDETL
jgi:fibronectin-binding autotransporter adhesin